MDSLFQTLKPPYYSVIFSSILKQAHDGYNEMAKQMEMLASQQPGYLGMDSVRETEGMGITVSYWKDEASIIAWKNNLIHLEAQKLGLEKWYEQYSLHITRVERAYHSSDSTT